MSIHLDAPRCLDAWLYVGMTLICLDAPSMFGWSYVCFDAWHMPPCMFGHPHMFGCPHMFGHPHMFGCVPICLELPYVCTPPICLVVPCILCAPYVWTPLCMVRCPTCLDNPLYVWMLSICLTSPCMFGCPQMYGGIQRYEEHPNIWGSVQIYGGVQRYGGIKTYKGHPNIWGHPNVGDIWNPLSLTKHALFVLYMYSRHPNIIKTYKGHPNMWGVQTYGRYPNILGHHNICGGVQTYGAIWTYRGVSRQTWGIHMYGGIWTPFSLIRHAFFVLCMYKGASKHHQNIEVASKICGDVQTYGVSKHTGSCMPSYHAKQVLPLVNSYVYNMYTHKIEIFSTSLALQQIREADAKQEHVTIMHNTECTCKIWWYMIVMLGLIVLGIITLIVLNVRKLKQVREHLFSNTVK